MKKIICYICATVLVAFSLTATSCSDDTSAGSATLSVSSTEEISFPANATEEDEVELTVTANTTWEVTANVSWCRGYRSGSKLTVVAEANSTTSARTAILTITAGNATPVEIQISQGVGTLTLSESTWSPPYNPDLTNRTKAIEITSDMDWGAVSNATAWCTIDKQTGTGIGTLTITVTENKGIARTATITVRIGAITKTVTVTQAANPAGAEDARITAIAAGTLTNVNTASTLGFNFTGGQNITAGTTINIVRTIAGAALTSAVPIDLGLTLNGTTGFSLNTAKVVEADNITYVGVVFTVSKSGETTAERTIQIPAAQTNANSTAGKLRATRTLLTAEGLNIYRYISPTLIYSLRTSSYEVLTLGTGVAIPSTSATNTAEIGTGVVSNISGVADDLVLITFSGTEPTTTGTMTFTNVPVTCAATTYTIPSINVAVPAIGPEL